MSDTTMGIEGSAQAGDGVAIATLQSRSMSQLAAEANAEHGQVVEAIRSGLAHALAAGRALNEAKAKFPVGESWTGWMRDNLSFCSATANLYMRVDRFRAELAEAEVGSYKDAIRFLQKHELRVRETLGRDEIDRIHAMVDAGVGQTEIGREFGVGRQTIHHHVAKRRRDASPRRRPVKYGITDDMIEGLACWFVERGYFGSLTDETRNAALEALGAAFRCSPMTSGNGDNQARAADTLHNQKQAA